MGTVDLVAGFPEHGKSLYGREPFTGAPKDRETPDQGQPAFPPGVVTEGAPDEPLSPTRAQQVYGPNYERLPDDLQATLKKLVQQYAVESDHARRQEIRRVKQTHQFWRGRHYGFWSEWDQNFHTPFEQKMFDQSQSSIEDLPRYEFVTNIYQAFGLSIIAVLSQDVPRVRLFPQSAESEADIATAKAGTKLIELVERNNRIDKLTALEAFHVWTGGKVGAYVRFVVDGSRFGFRQEPCIEPQQVKMGPDRLRCLECGYEEVQKSGSQEVGTLGAREGGAEIGGGPGLAGLGGIEPNLAGRGDQEIERSGGPDFPTSRLSDLLPCPQCGGATALVPGETATVPRQTGSKRVPNGQEVITIVGALELKTPPWAGEFSEYPYLQWNMETHISKLRATYPHVADKIGPPVVPGASEQFERLARLAQSQGGPLTEGGDFNMNLITFQRTWLRPAAFWLLEQKDQREKLLALYPDGAYVALAGDTYCESRSESMDDHWRVMHAMPGDGSSTGRPALGDSLISVQERFNTLTNLQVETYEYGVPPTYIDSELMDPTAVQNQTAEPGALYFVKGRRPGEPLGAGFHTPPPAQVAPDMVKHEMDLMGPIAQFLSGAFPALFGGEAKGAGGDTASGYSMQREQALGRIGLVWREMKQFHADIMMLAVDTFRKNRPEDVEIPVYGPGGRFESEWIHLADLKGNILAHPETDTQYPTIWSQQRAVYLQLLQMGANDPEFARVLGHPDNLALGKRLLGLEELVMPDEESQIKQHREIADLLQAEPNVQADPSTGAEQVIPTILPDEFADNHLVELETCKRWFSSDMGQGAKAENPAGYANVRAHALLHQQILQAQMMPQGMPIPAAAGQGTGKGIAPAGPVQ